MEVVQSGYRIEKSERRYGGIDMDCKEIQKKYIPFIDNELGRRELDAFLRHLNECQDCREEYDIYYTMIMGMRYLEEESEKNWIDSEERLQSAQEYLTRCRIKYWGKIGILAVLCIGCMILF